MMYLVTTSSTLAGVSDDVGVIIGPRVGGIRPVKEGRKWAADNDAFHGRFDPERFETHLARLAPYRENCLFVATPDVLGDAEATLQLFGVWAQSLEDGGFPPAYVCQDGSEHLPFPNGARAIFLGGSTAWKSAQLTPMTRRAKEAGLWMHVGRVNSARRLHECAAAGADSVDGTYLGFRGVERGLREVQGWLRTAQKGLYSC